MFYELVTDLASMKNYEVTRRKKLGFFVSRLIAKERALRHQNCYIIRDLEYGITSISEPV
jgi:hypothetical protein